LFSPWRFLTNCLVYRDLIFWIKLLITLFLGVKKGCIWGYFVFGGFFLGVEGVGGVVILGFFLFVSPLMLYNIYLYYSNMEIKEDICISNYDGMVLKLRKWKEFTIILWSFCVLLLWYLLLCWGLYILVSGWYYGRMGLVGCR
jgi:hypothetical protein